jgi:apolipoprotein N-acyltransferase
MARTPDPAMLEKITSWLHTRSFLVRALLCLAGGLLGALALPPLSWPIFFFPGFILTVFYLRESKTFLQSFTFGFLYALGYHVAGLYWISASLFIDIARYIWVLPFSALALPCWLALLFALGSVAAHVFRKTPIRHALILAGTLFFSEAARGTLLTGFPWNFFGDIWSEALPLLQSVSLIGIYGLTFLTLLAGSLSSLLLRPFTRTGLALVILSWATLSGLALWGEVRLQQNPTAYNETVLIRMVQPGIPQAERRTYEQRQAALVRLAEISSEKTETAPTHLLWPETATPDFLNQRPGLRTMLSRLIPKGGALLTGAPKQVEKEGAVFYSNSLFVLDDRGTILGNYDKHHLVPFGEFVPLRGILKAMPVATDVIGGRADFTPGPGPRTLRAPGFPSFSPLICYEAIFSGDILDRRDPPEILLQITNDAWFGNTSGPHQHFSHARLRAIEEGLPLLRAANSGISAVVDPLGRIVAKLPLGKTGFLDIHPPQRVSRSTLFYHYGNWPIFVLILLATFVIATTCFLCKRQNY